LHECTSIESACAFAASRSTRKKSMISMVEQQEEEQAMIESQHSPAIEYGDDDCVTYEG
jgi:hypothetical protein